MMRSEMAIQIIITWIDAGETIKKGALFIE